MKTSSLNHCGLWIDHTNAAEWAELLRLEVTAWLAPLAGLAPDALDGLTIKVFPPTREEAANAMAGNYDLRGAIFLEWHGKPLSLEIPMSYHGVFLSHRPESQHPAVSVWTGWLADNPGIRLVKTPGTAGECKDLKWKIGLPGGRFLKGDVVKSAENKGMARLMFNVKDGMRTSTAPSQYLDSRHAFPECLSEHVAAIGVIGKAGRKDLTEEMWNALLEVPLADLGAATDEDDLEHRILMTFPVWLKHRVAKTLLVELLKAGRAQMELAKKVSAVLSGEPGDRDLAEEAWAYLAGREAVISRRVVVAVHNHRSTEHADLVDPINPVDLAARITRFKRMLANASRLERVSARCRQNHPSFQGRVCPVDSPESSMVGLTLHLAAGARVDLDGKILPANLPALGLGYGAGLIPFFGYNDGARNMMGAKNLRQAEPSCRGEEPAVWTGGEARLMDFVRPALEIGVCPKSELHGKPDDAKGSAGLALGKDLLVAYLPWYGRNFEDAVVLGQQVVDNGWLDIALHRTPVRKSIPVGWVPCTDGQDDSLGTDGLAIEGSMLIAGRAIARFMWEGGDGSLEPMTILHKDRTPAILKSIAFKRRSPWAGGVLEYTLETPISVKPGDKLMGRHGNKGVVGAILPESEMPRLPDDKSIPKALRGRTIDILLNPHGVISRMNLGQLMETHLGWLLRAGGCCLGDLITSRFAADHPLPEAFSTSLDHGKVRDALANTGLDRYGRVKLVLPDGTRTASPVVVGFQHIVRLKHVPETKSQARRGGIGATYSARTGQAIHGRSLGGGQRIGEMEEWALAAHGADRIIDEMLGVKSSADLAVNWRPGKDEASLTSEKDGFSRMLNQWALAADWQPGRNGFAGLLEDWLFALMIGMDRTSDHVKLRFVQPHEVMGRAGEMGEVTSPEGLVAAPSSPFRCCHGGKESCEFRLLDGASIAFPSTAGGKAGQASALCHSDYLAHLNLSGAGPLVEKEDHHELPVRNHLTGEIEEPVRLTFKPANSALAASAAWKEMTFHLYGQFPNKDGSGGNLTGDEILQGFLHPELHRPAIGRMRIACPHHPSKPLSSVEPYQFVRRGMPGGLFDPEIFGHNTGTQASGTAPRWGYIRLPRPVSHPFAATKRSDKTEDNSDCSARLIEAIPVLPIRYRMPTVRKDSVVEDPIDEKGYAPLVRLCAAYRENEESRVKESDPEKQADLQKKLKGIAKAIETQVAKLFNMFAKAFDGKEGIIRRHGLGRRVDRSARMVITPNPDLGWDQVGLPATAMLELFGDVVEAWWNEVAVGDIAQTMAFPSDLSWSRPHESPKALAAATEILKRFLTANPDYVVLLNRQPSLHRDSFQAFHPVVLPENAGEVIQLCPLVCKGFGADFDGDEMVVHVPLSEQAQREARKMLPSQNWFSLGQKGTGNHMAHFDQDFVLGTWWLGKGRDQCGEQFEQLLAKLPAELANEVIPATGPISKDTGSDLLQRLAGGNRDEAVATVCAWMQRAFASCTEMGVSFGFYELADLAAELKKSIPDKPLDTDRNGDLDKITMDALRRLLEDASTGLNTPGLHFAAMAVSGARGAKQVRQLIAARGELNPGATCFELTDDHKKRFFIERPLANGLNENEAFWAAMNARSSMCDKKLGTGQAGGLTRHLVFALRSHEIVSRDCSPDDTPANRSLLTCREKHGFCAKCYGALPDGNLPLVGFRAGIVAAQSIGERGTQLSMQSFHAGKKEIDIMQVRRVLGLAGANAKFQFLEPSEADAFVKFFKDPDGETKAYRDLDDRHLLLLWTVLHRAALASANTVDGTPKVPSSKKVTKTQAMSLKKAIEGGNPLDLLAYSEPDKLLAAAIRDGLELSKSSPFAKLLL